MPLGGNCTAGDGFVGLVIADIDNSNSGCSTDGYGIFPDLTTDLAQGATYPVTVTTGAVVSTTFTVLVAVPALPDASVDV